MTTYQFCSTISQLQCTCGVWFTPTNAKQKFCSKQCAKKASNHTARTLARATYEIEFIGVDGEGVNIVYPDGHKEHRYVMLSVGDETLWKNGAELTHQDIFPFLYDCYLANPAAAFVGFYLGYDFTMWLKSLREDRAVALFTPAIRQRKKGPNPVPFPVYVDDWEIDILGLRRFKIRPASDLDKNPHSWMYICDTGAYFQTSFLNVINPANWPEPVCTEAEYAKIKAGKENRSNDVLPDDTSYVSDMVEYNRLENNVLARVMKVLNSGFIAAGVKLQRDSFYGPGQAIQKWLDQLVERGAYLPHKYLEEDMPAWVIDAFRAAYYGGRFEIFYHGHLPGETYEYDITSAYPHAMRNLPCLCSQNWSRGLGHHSGSYDILLVQGRFWSSQRTLCGLPFRNPKGNILYPTETAGWYLWSEIHSAIEAGLIDRYEIVEWIGFTKTCDHTPPLQPLADLFYTRLKIGKQTPQGKAIKLMINSAYGKFAQSIGHPKYGNPVYASMITSECRRMILTAIATHPNGINDTVMIATDGIYFRKPHPVLDALPDHEQLGGWEPAIKHNVCLMKPGVYWDDKARDAVRNGKIASIKSRGISAQTLADNMVRIDQGFHDYYSGKVTELPSLSVNVSFAVTSPKLALARGKWYTAGSIEWDGSRTESASLAPKRANPYRDGPYVRSDAMMVPQGSETTPYDKRFGFDPDWGIDQEGNLDAIIAETFTRPT